MTFICQYRVPDLDECNRLGSKSLRVSRPFRNLRLLLYLPYSSRIEILLSQWPLHGVKHTHTEYRIYRPQEKKSYLRKFQLLAELLVNVKLHHNRQDSGLGHG